MPQRNLFAASVLVLVAAVPAFARQSPVPARSLTCAELQALVQRQGPRRDFDRTLRVRHLRQQLRAPRYPEPRLRAGARQSPMPDRLQRPQQV